MNPLLKPATSPADNERWKPGEIIWMWGEKTEDVI